MIKGTDSIREELWKDIAVAVASSSNVAKSEICTIWADQILAEFDKRFVVPDKRCIDKVS